MELFKVGSCQSKHFGLQRPKNSTCADEGARAVQPLAAVAAARPLSPRVVLRHGPNPPLPPLSIPSAPAPLRRFRRTPPDQAHRDPPDNPSPSGPLPSQANIYLTKSSPRFPLAAYATGVPR